MIYIVNKVYESINKNGLNKLEIKKLRNYLYYNYILLFWGSNSFSLILGFNEN